MITRKIPETCSSFESAQKVSELTLVNVFCPLGNAHYATADQKNLDKSSNHNSNAMVTHFFREKVCHKTTKCRRVAETSVRQYAR